jgi:hypothetical protein
MAEQERLLANEQEGVRTQAAGSSSLFCCCRSGPLTYAAIGDAAEDAANALITELSVMPTMWTPEARDARVVDALQRIWMAIAGEHTHVMRLAPPRIPSRDWRKIGFQVCFRFFNFEALDPWFLSLFEFIHRLAHLLRSWHFPSCRVRIRIQTCEERALLASLTLPGLQRSTQVSEKHEKVLCWLLEKLSGFQSLAFPYLCVAEARMIGASGEQGEMPFGIGALNVLWMLRCHLQLFAPNDSPPAFCPCCGAAGVAQEYGPRQPHRGRHIRGFAMLLLDDRDAWMHVFALSFLVTAALWRKRGETMLVNDTHQATVIMSKQKRGSAAAVLDAGSAGASNSVRSSLTGVSGPGGTMLLAGSEGRKERSRSRRSSSRVKDGSGLKHASSGGHLDALDSESGGGGGMRPASSSGQLTDDVANVTTAGASSGAAGKHKVGASGAATETASGEVRSASGSLSQASASLAAGGLTVVQRTASSSSASHLASADGASSSPSTHADLSSVHHQRDSAKPSVVVGDLRLLQFNSILHEAKDVIMEALSTFPPDLTALRATLFRKLRAKGLASNASSSASTGPGAGSTGGGAGLSVPSPYYHQASRGSYGGPGEMVAAGNPYHDLTLQTDEGLPIAIPTGHRGSHAIATNSTLKAASVKPVAPQRGLPGAGLAGAGGDDEHLLYLSSDSAGLNALPSSSYAATTPPFGTSPGLVAGSWQAQAPGFGHSYGAPSGMGGIPHGVSKAAQWGSRTGGLHAPSDLSLGYAKDGVVTLDESPGPRRANNAGYEIEG